MTNAQRLSIVIAVIFGGAELSGCAAQVAAFKKADAAARGATEACFGVARAGQNDCRTHANVCAGWSRRDRDPGAFVYVPAGSCQKIVGGRNEES